LAHEARDEPVIAPAAADRAEANGATFLVFDLERELNLVDRAGVVLKAADHRPVDADAVAIAACRYETIDLSEFIPSRARHACFFAGNRRNDTLDLRRIQFSTFCIIAALIFAPFAKQHPHAVDAEAIELVDRAHGGKALLCRNAHS